MLIVEDDMIEFWAVTITGTKKLSKGRTRERKWNKENKIYNFCETKIELPCVVFLSILVMSISSIRKKYFITFFSPPILTNLIKSKEQQIFQNEMICKMLFFSRAFEFEISRIYSQNFSKIFFIWCFFKNYY